MMGVMAVDDGIVKDKNKKSAITVGTFDCAAECSTVCFDPDAS